MRRALVSGAAGFIGRHFSRQLVEDGWAVDGFDVQPVRTLTQGRFLHHGWQADARDWFRTDRTSPGDYDLVIHAAAVVGGRAKIEGDPLAVAVNLGIDAEMFRWALRTRPQQVVYFSSSAVYPVELQADPLAHPFVTPVPLAEPLVNPAAARHGTPDEVYGWCKLTGEILADKARAQGLDVRVYRPFSGYGEDQPLDYPFPSLIARAVAREDPFTIWGSGQQVRDWVHVDDIVRTVLTAVEDDDMPGPMNIGTGVGTSFLDLARMICDRVGYFPRLLTLPGMPSGVAYRVADPDWMNTVVGPARVSLAAGIERAVAATVPA